MGFKSIQLNGFRNLSDGRVYLDAQNVYLFGENGQGKTNFLEALYLLSYGSSFRTRQLGNLVRWNLKSMRVCGEIETPNEPCGTLSVSWDDGEKTIQLHGKNVNDRKEMLERLPTVVFIHNDFLFASGSPERRRWFVDQTLSMHDTFYIDQLRKYKKVLKERNHLIKRGKTKLLEHFGERLAHTGLAVSKRRENLIREFGDFFVFLYQKISGMEGIVRLEYFPSWGKAKNIGEVMDILSKNLGKDMEEGITRSGPHRDQYKFTMGGRDFAKSASTGQQRLLSLVLRITQARLYSKITGRKPLLLLDDVLLELDSGKRGKFHEQLPEAEQTFYTFLPGEGRREWSSLTYEIKGGVLNAIGK